MSGNREGGLKTAAKVKQANANFYAEIGSIGGSKRGIKKGFAVDRRTWFQKLLRRPKQAALAGRKGGKISKRIKENSENL